MGSVSLGQGTSPGERNGNPLWYSHLGNPTDRGAWQAIVHGVAKESDVAEMTKEQHSYFHVLVGIAMAEMNPMK